MNRQFAHIKLVKRAGRGSYQDGIATTPPGALAIQCPACPRPGVNLPDNWSSLPSSEQWSPSSRICKNVLGSGGIKDMYL